MHAAAAHRRNRVPVGARGDTLGVKVLAAPETDHDVRLPRDDFARVGDDSFAGRLLQRAPVGCPISRAD